MDPRQPEKLDPSKLQGLREDAAALATSVGVSQGDTSSWEVFFLVDEES